MCVVADRRELGRSPAAAVRRAGHLDRRPARRARVDGDRSPPLRMGTAVGDAVGAVAPVVLRDRRGGPVSTGVVRDERRSVRKHAEAAGGRAPAADRLADRDRPPRSPPPLRAARAPPCRRRGPARRRGHAGRAEGSRRRGLPDGHEARGRPSFGVEHAQPPAADRRRQRDRGRAGQRQGHDPAHAGAAPGARRCSGRGTGSRRGRRRSSASTGRTARRSARCGPRSKSAIDRARRPCRCGWPRLPRTT